VSTLFLRRVTLFLVQRELENWCRREIFGKLLTLFGEGKIKKVTRKKELKTRIIDTWFPILGPEMVSKELESVSNCRKIVYGFSESGGNGRKEKRSKCL